MQTPPSAESDFSTHLGRLHGWTIFILNWMANYLGELTTISGLQPSQLRDLKAEIETCAKQCRLSVDVSKWIADILLAVDGQRVQEKKKLVERYKEGIEELIKNLRTDALRINTPPPSLPTLDADDLLQWREDWMLIVQTWHTIIGWLENALPPLQDIVNSLADDQLKSLPAGMQQLLNGMRQEAARLDRVRQVSQSLSTQLEDCLTARQADEQRVISVIQECELIRNVQTELVARTNEQHTRIAAQSEEIVSLRSLNGTLANERDVLIQVYQENLNERDTDIQHLETENVALKAKVNRLTEEKRELNAQLDDALERAQLEEQKVNSTRAINSQLTEQVAQLQMRLTGQERSFQQETQRRDDETERLGRLLSQRDVELANLGAANVEWEKRLNEQLRVQEEFRQRVRQRRETVSLDSLSVQDQLRLYFRLLYDALALHFAARFPHLAQILLSKGEHDDGGDGEEDEDNFVMRRLRQSINEQRIPFHEWHEWMANHLWAEVVHPSLQQ